MRFPFLLGAFLLLFHFPLFAGGGLFLTRQAGKALSSQEIHLQRAIAAHLERDILAHSSAARLARTNREAFLRSAKTIPFQAMATLSASPRYLPAKTDPIFALRNDQAALPWFEIIEKDLAFMRAQHKHMRQTIQVRYQAPQEIDYVSLIPSHVRKIYIGEEHSQPAIYQAVEKMILDYHAANPQREIILLTEFVSDRLFPWQTPGRPVGRLTLPFRRVDKDFVFFNRLADQGIQIIGLENLAYRKDHEALITPENTQAESVIGMQERNAHWRRIIGYVATQHPQATLFIYTGSLHTHYRAPFTLVNPSEQNFVFQLESAQLGKDMPFGFVMQKEKFTRARGTRAAVLSWSAKDPVYRTRSGFDACIIFPSEEP